MKSIVFFEQYGSLGGGQQVLVELIRAATHCGYAATALIPPGTCARQCATAGATVGAIPPLLLRMGKKGVWDVLKLGAYACAVLLKHWPALRRADMLYVNGERLLPAALLASLLFRKQAIYHIHLDHAGFERLLFLLALQCRLTRFIAVPSRFIAQRLRRYSGRFEDPRVVTLENGLDARFAAISYTDVFSRRPLRHVGCISRVSPEKGQDALLPLARAFPEMTFHVFGDAGFADGAYYAGLRQTAPSNVRFHGWVENIPAQAKEFGLQICLAPSRCSEAAPLVPLQMVALSCLMIVRRVGAQTDIADELGLRTFDDDEDLPGIFRRLLTARPEMLADETRSSYERAMALYGHEVYKERLRAFFRRMWDNPEPGHA
ncbi:MAG: glycosyltransferase family 4 protein [Desulfovibrio sp.]|jgi:glycosyltransferase involved in cell wall biosynthesis|nr:glycosyltransferase family 4 protein [Desulfovibrio sp.]